MVKKQIKGSVLCTVIISLFSIKNNNHLKLIKRNFLLHIPEHAYPMILCVAEIMECEKNE